MSARTMEPDAEMAESGQDGAVESEAETAVYPVIHYPTRSWVDMMSCFHLHPRDGGLVFLKR